MGWWWSSSSPAEATSTASSPSLSNAQSSSSSTSTTTTLPQNLTSNPTTSTTTPTTREDAELREFLAAIEWTGDTKPSPNNSNSNNNNALPSSSPSSDPDPSDISFESLYPTSMSCRSAFDYAFFCQSFGGQWVNVYRYGELRSCSEHWENFWLCMKARGYSDESRKATIRDHYRQKAVKYKTGPSSEDVWEVRTEPVQNPFMRDMADYQQQKEKIEGERLGQV